MMAASGAGATSANAAVYRVGYAVDLGSLGKHTVGTLAPRSNTSGNRVVCIESLRSDGEVKAGLAKTDYQLAYLLSKYVNTSDNVTAAALAVIVKNKLDQSQPIWKLILDKFKESSNWSAVNKKITVMQNEAKENAGPYTLKLSFTDAKDLTVNVTNVGVKTGSGKWLTGVDIVLSASNAVFVSNNSSTLTVKSTSTALTIAVKATDPSKQAEIVAKTSKQLPATAYRLLPSVAGDKQDMVTLEPLTGTTSELVRHSFSVQPELTS
ncbi:MAG: hypothetical protein FWG47_07760, partial [Propionibacteriaceae bacterium]|nr:hypothetical protein [Propionibacteriaceae bacterium]